MGLLDKDLEQLNAGSNYKFSATKIDKLGSSEYTLATIVMDVSGSVTQFAAQLETMIKTIFKSLFHSQRKEFLMLRFVTFNQSLLEVHGFRLLGTINEDDYTGTIQCGGSTALFEATNEVIQASTVYGANLMKQDFLANAIIFVVTDGENNCPPMLANVVKTSLENARRAENLESINVVLIGVTNDDANLGHYLQTFKDDAGITQYINIGKATPGKLAKLGGFISQSVSSTSSALGTGTASQPIAHTF